MEKKGVRAFTSQMTKRERILALLWLPVHLCLRLILLIAMLVTAVSGWVFRLVGTIFLLTTICSAGFGLASKEELMSMLITSLGILLAPVIAETIVTILDVVIP